MPAVKGGFKLKPFGFFNANPCLDICPPPCEKVDPIAGTDQHPKVDNAASPDHKDHVTGTNVPPHIHTHSQVPHMQAKL